MAAKPLVLHGRVVTFDPDRPLIDDGVVYIGGDELIAAVQTRTDPPPAGFDTAAHVETEGCIYPGLIDLHNHIVYNCLSLWSPPGRTEPYTSRYQWPGHHSYKSMISDPGTALGALAGKAHLKYVETKAVVGGVTAIQGSAKTGRPYEGWLVRNVEDETFKTKRKMVFQSALPFRDEKGYETARKHLEAHGAFIYHLSEGTDAKLIDEYTKVRDEGLLLPGFCAIHCTALERPNYDEWETPPRGGAVVWSPFSNLWLYRDTTDVAAAKEEGMLVCLGADWSPSGSKSLLGELKVADMWNQAEMAGELSNPELCAMATCNPADAVNWSDRIGRLRPGLHGDVLVTTDRGGDPYRNLIETIERDVALVAINGYPCYGTSKLMKAAGAERAERIEVGGRERRIVLVYPGIPDADMGWQEVLADLNAARTHPQARWEEVRAHVERQQATGEGGPQDHLWLRLDKPWDEARAPAEAVAAAVDIPPLDPLTHDTAYFDAVKASPLHGGRLDRLHEYYKRR
ncbi:MAG: amidohydrolase family protein [Actinomycetota bacterium]|nr:amidohydrolase family protein [Actinomycetota bacterium]